MFYVVDSTSKKPDSHVNLGGNGNIEITGIDVDFAYPEGSFPSDFDIELHDGISIFQARPSDHGGAYGNTNDATIIGTSNMDLQGTIYFPKNHLDLGGTCDSVGNQLLVDTMKIHGTGELGIKYKGPNPAAGNKVFLVHPLSDTTQ